MFWQLALATCWRLTLVAKNACLEKSGSAFKNLFSFPSNLLWLFTFSLNWNSSKHSVSLSTNSIFTLVHLQIFKKKVWVLISSPHISCFELHFREYLCWCFFFSFFLWVCFIFFWIVLVWIVEVLFLCELVSVDRFMYYHMLVSLTHFVWTWSVWVFCALCYFICGESGLESLTAMWLKLLRDQSHLALSHWHEFMTVYVWYTLLVGLVW